MNNYKELVADLREKESRDNRELLDAAADAIEQQKAELERLEAENRAKEQYIAETISKVIRERDAAIADIEKHCRYCVVCKNADFTDGYKHNRCHRCLDEENRYFEWRGVGG